MPKQQRPAQSQYEMLESFMTNFILTIFCCLEAMLANGLRRKSISNKTNLNKSLLQDLRYRSIEL